MPSLIPLLISQQLFLLKTGRRLREGEHRTTSWPPLALCRELDPDDNLNRFNECVGGGELFVCVWCVCVCVCVAEEAEREGGWLIVWQRLISWSVWSNTVLILICLCSWLPSTPTIPLCRSDVRNHFLYQTIWPFPVLYCSSPPRTAEAQCSPSVEMFRRWEPLLTSTHDWTFLDRMYVCS